MTMVFPAFLTCYIGQDVIMITHLGQIKMTNSSGFLLLMTLTHSAFCLPIASHGFCHASATVICQRICRSSLYERIDTSGLVTPLVIPLVTSLGKFHSE